MVMRSLLPNLPPKRCAPLVTTNFREPNKPRDSLSITIQHDSESGDDKKRKEPSKSNKRLRQEQLKATAAGPSHVMATDKEPVVNQRKTREALIKAAMQAVEERAEHYQLVATQSSEKKSTKPDMAELPEGTAAAENLDCDLCLECSGRIWNAFCNVPPENGPSYNWMKDLRCSASSGKRCNYCKDSQLRCTPVCTNALFITSQD